MSNGSISSFSIDPEAEAFRALMATICTICRRQGITSAEDARLRKIVDRYSGRYPSLTPRLVEEEIRRMEEEERAATENTPRPPPLPSSRQGSKSSSRKSKSSSRKSGSGCDQSRIISPTRSTSRSTSLPFPLSDVDLTDRHRSIAASSLGASRRSLSSSSGSGSGGAEAAGAEGADAAPPTDAAVGPPPRDRSLSTIPRNLDALMAAIAASSSSGGGVDSRPPSRGSADNGGSNRSSTSKNAPGTTAEAIAGGGSGGAESTPRNLKFEKRRDSNAEFDAIASGAAGRGSPWTTPAVGPPPRDAESAPDRDSVEVSPSKRLGPDNGEEDDGNNSEGGPMMVMYDMPCCTEDEERMAHKLVYPRTARQEPHDPSTSGCCAGFRRRCRENGGYNLLTYSLLLSFFVLLMFLTSIMSTYANYNRTPYRDWALAGGVTPTSARFRVRGPSVDDGKRREFVVSANPNLALERGHLLNVPVSFGDFAEGEHFVKGLEMTNLTPSTTYYYGIIKPKRTPNSAVVAGDVGSFRTPGPEGARMDFTFATGSCALTGSESDVFKKILEKDPLLFLHTGDFHYEDLDTPDVDERLEAYDRVMGSDSQRLLYMRTIFSYMWDDHDWLGNNRDSTDEDASSAARRGYTLGMPHYPLAQRSREEGDGAKYQAFTIGTVRFVITDLRSESIKSSERFGGRIYSKEQRDWLYDEFSRASQYDFVVWATTRPWTDPDEPGSDGWGGFVADRDELSRYIADTIGAGPRNLLVVGGDNHMVAFDDGSNTDYSNQGTHPGGFPLLHSGPLTNYGSGMSDFFRPGEHRFTDGCMAVSNEVNHQFSTVDFRFPEADDRTDREGEACLRIRSYSKDSEDPIFEREMCGETMRFGAPEEPQQTCTLKKFTVPTMSLLASAAGLVVLNGTMALYFLGIKRCALALSYLGLGMLFYVLTVAAAVAGAYCLGTRGVNVFGVSVLVLVQVCAGFLFVSMALVEHHFSAWRPDGDAAAKRRSNVVDDEEAGARTMPKDVADATETNAMATMMGLAEDGAEDATTHDGTMSEPSPTAGGATKRDGDAETTTMASQMGEEVTAPGTMRRAMPHGTIPEENDVISKERSTTDAGSHASAASRFLRKASSSMSGNGRSKADGPGASAAAGEGGNATVAVGSDGSRGGAAGDSSSQPPPETAAVRRGSGGSARDRAVPAPERAPAVGTMLPTYLPVRRGSRGSAGGEKPAPAETRRTSTVAESDEGRAVAAGDDEDDSVAAVLCGENTNATSSFETKMTSVLSSAKNVSLPRGVKERANAALELARDSLFSNNAAEGGREREDNASSDPKLDETMEVEEGIEVTNPVSKGYKIRVSPSLISM